ncbi:MAG: hypothetical protein FGF48_09480 [Candidatus Brockarchaeota archaeon]|nr:hypothetical protein [Candidatus Brockarchaeota archaeon]
MIIWRKFGFTLSDIVRQSIYLLPDSPNSAQKTERGLSRFKAMRKGSFEVKLKDEKDALEALQEW